MLVTTNSNPRRILDPRLKSVMPEMWPSSCAIVAVTYTPDDSNQPVPTGTTNVPGMEDIECRLGPLFEVRPDDKEIRLDHITQLTLQREIKLNGYYPAILPHTMQAIVGGVTYNIAGTEADGNSFSTRLRVEIITP